ncbi:MAG: hypothetical protein HYY06_15160 [Deltaproteobacteria bacterium]|nr:hypothetical protein [Deltaproteobacteria bacterium]
MEPIRIRLFALACGLLLVPGLAAAQDEEVSAPLVSTDGGALGRYLQPAEFTNVIDAFDEDDPFDLNVSIGYERTLRRGKVRRESNNPGVSEDGYIDYVDLARYSQLTNTLVISGAIGLYHDLQLWTRWPLVLSDTRELKLDDAVTAEQGQLRRDCGTGGADPETCLFDLPFKSPERSGVDSFSLGLDWGILSQERDDTKPNWVLGVEAAFGIGSQLEAATEDEDGGISRGTVLLAASSSFSHRYRYLEPYLGVRFSIEIPKGDSLFPDADEFKGRLNTLPPIVGAMLFGAEIVPWENAQSFQRFSIDLRASGTFNSEGRNYSELFDALGTSQHPQILQPNKSGQEFNGMTDVENYGTFAGRLSLNVQAARYVKFNLGAILAHDQEHGITFTDACNPDADVAVAQAPCTRGAPNPDHRPVIDLPGHRFRVEESTIFTFFATGTAMF